MEFFRCIENLFDTIIFSKTLPKVSGYCAGCLPPRKIYQPIIEIKTCGSIDEAPLPKISSYCIGCLPPRQFCQPAIEIKKCVLIDGENVSLKRKIIIKITKNYDVCFIVTKMKKLPKGIARHIRTPKALWANVCIEQRSEKLTHSERATDDLYLTYLANSLKHKYCVTVYSNDKFRGLYEQSRVAKTAKIDIVSIKGIKKIPNSENFNPKIITREMTSYIQTIRKEVSMLIKSKSKENVKMMTNNNFKLCYFHKKQRLIFHLTYLCKERQYGCRSEYSCL